MIAVAGGIILALFILTFWPLLLGGAAVAGAGLAYFAFRALKLFVKLLPLWVLIIAGFNNSRVGVAVALVLAFIWMSVWNGLKDGAKESLDSE